MVAHVQNHIHLDDALTVDAELSPVSKWKVHERQVIPIVFLSVRRSKTAKLFPNVLRDGSNAVAIRNFRYQLRVQGSTPEATDVLLEDILSWYGERIFLIDNFHCNDGEDHTTYVRPVILTEVEPLKVDDWSLLRYYVNIMLESDSV